MFGNYISPVHNALSCIKFYILFFVNGYKMFEDVNFDDFTTIVKINDVYISRNC